MTKQEQLKELQSRIVALRTLMIKSDAHAAKCAKMGKKFATQYPDDYAEYVAANEEYQQVEAQAAKLEEEITAEEQAAVDEPAEASAE